METCGPLRLFIGELEVDGEDELNDDDAVDKGDVEELKLTLPAVFCCNCCCCWAAMAEIMYGLGDCGCMPVLTAMRELVKLPGETIRCGRPRLTDECW